MVMIKNKITIMMKHSQVLWLKSKVFVLHPHNVKLLNLKNKKVVKKMVANKIVMVMMDLVETVRKMLHMSFIYHVQQFLSVQASRKTSFLI